MKPILICVSAAAAAALAAQAASANSATPVVETFIAPNLISSPFGSGHPGPVVELLASLFDEFIGRQTGVGFELLLGLHQAGVDIEDLGVFQALDVDDRRAGADLAHGLEGGGEHLLVEPRKALLQKRERFLRVVVNI